ncbi:MAG: ornithine--oxo-acid transaminase [Acidobacteriota bacterium]
MTTQTQTTRTSELIALSEAHGAHNYHPLPIVIDRAEGIWVYDPEGRKYLDFLSSYSALNQGHRHPRIIGALKAQADKVTLTSRAFYNAEIGPFFKELCAVTGMEAVLPMNTGAEAVETAIKAARKWAYKKKGVKEGLAEIVVCENNFHGRTTTIVGFSTEAQYRDGFGPFAPGFKVIPYGDTRALESAITENTAAFLVEPIQGEAGVIVPPAGYMAVVRQICTSRNVLLVADEVQTGFARTGRMFACEHDGVKPDILIMGKALGGGVLPVSAIAAPRAIMDVFTPGDHGSTFGGNPLACAVARAALAVLADEHLAERAHELGEYFMQRLRDLGSPHTQEVRGRGLLIGLELKKSSGPARPFCERLMQESLLCKETHEQVVRFAPPLTIAKDEIDWALERIARVLA